METDQKYPNILAAVFGSVWAIMPEKLEAIVAFLELKAAGGTIDAAEIEKIQAARSTKFAGTSGSVAVIPIFGTISQRMTMLAAYSGGTSTQRIGSMLDTALADDSIGSIILDIDSPGGSVYGVSELSDKIYNSRQQQSGKPIIAVVNSLMASAAFWIGSAADEIIITPGGEAGSVGVVAVHRDLSKAEEKVGQKTTYVYAGKYKIEGNPFEPLGNEARAAIQDRVDDYYTMFVDDLARNRGVSTKTVTGRFGQGRVVGAESALEAKMVDRIATFEQVVADLQGRCNRKKRTRAASRGRDMELARIRRP